MSESEKPEPSGISPAFLFMLIMILGVIYVTIPRREEIKAKVNDWKERINNTPNHDTTNHETAAETSGPKPDATARTAENQAKPKSKVQTEPPKNAKPVDNLSVEDRKKLDELINKF